MTNTFQEHKTTRIRHVFGVIRKASISSTQLPRRKEGMKLLAAANAELNKVLAERNTVTLLTRELRLTADNVYRTGQEV